MNTGTLRCERCGRPPSPRVGRDALGRPRFPQVGIGATEVLPGGRGGRTGQIRLVPGRVGRTRSPPPTELEPFDRAVVEGDLDPEVPIGPDDTIAPGPDGSGEDRPERGHHDVGAGIATPLLRRRPIMASGTA